MKDWHRRKYLHEPTWRRRWRFVRSEPFLLVHGFPGCSEPFRLLAVSVILGLPVKIFLSMLRKYFQGTKRTFSCPEATRGPPPWPGVPRAWAWSRPRRPRGRGHTWRGWGGPPPSWALRPSPPTRCPSRRPSSRAGTPAPAAPRCC